MTSISTITLDPPMLSLRDMHDGDDAFLGNLYALTRDDLRALPMPDAFIAELIFMQQKVHETGQRSAFPHARRWVVQWHGEAVGRLVVDMDGAEWRLVDIALLPASRGQGIGSAIVHWLQQGAAARQCAIALAVAPSNAAARRLYTGMGFTVRGADELQEQMAWMAPRR